MMDIPFAALVTRRRIRFMGKASLFEVPVLGTLFTCARRLLGRARRHRPQGGARVGGDARHGEVLCVYPEGTRQNGRKIQPLQPGAAYFALRSGVPIVPVGIAGAEEILRAKSDPIPRFGRVTIVVGAPIVPEARDESGWYPASRSTRSPRAVRRAPSGARRRVRAARRQVADLAFAAVESG